MPIDAESIKTLRERTGAGILDCKNTLEKMGGDMDKAAEILRKKGFQVAEKKAARTTNEGRIGSYIHFNGKVGVLLELNCESDFVARNEVVEQLMKDLCMQVAAASPLAVSREDVPKEEVERQKEAFKKAATDKPPQIQEKIIQGKLESFYKEKCLLDQPFIKDDTQTIKDVINICVAKVGENIRVRRFARFEVGQ
ncbi:MAG TPA: translation elongation factor Ts [Candidatus Tripitaka californicus]|uniref:translation elongation factor Ts n=1 Tax=Candidatus Tripitaka californicus TaxID=3367616 RepID=UPI004026FCAB|nr:elongation factor Ts [Planctomycetota bacterium]